MKINIRFLWLPCNILLIMAKGFGQSEGLTSSPYSLYGMGVVNQTGIGRSNGMGYLGIGLKTETEINNLNPANFALIPQNSFFYDVGISGEYNTYSNKFGDEAKVVFNFSNLAIAFRITDGLGAGITMVPYSKMGYTLIGVQSNIEGSNATFESNVSGVGGLNDLRLNIGYSVWKGLRLGASASLLFGNVEEEESFQVGSSTFNLTENTNYTGLRMGLGMQFDLTEKTTIGSTIQLPVDLKGRIRRSVLKNIEGTDIAVEDDSVDNASDFGMPLEVGVGFSSKWFNVLTFGADYKKNYWSTTGQTENIGVYKDQDIFAVGLEYLKDPVGYKYKDRIRYRAGFNYDNGYLAIGNKKVEGYNFTAGLGFPISKGTHSMVNLSYGYGSKGQIRNVLIKEDYHMVTLNLSLEDLWFRKVKIN